MEQSTGPLAPVSRPTVRLTRSRDDRMVAGVCGGTARALGVDPALVRLGLVLLTVFGAGAGAIAYVAAWILLPEEGAAV
ncbi:PspC domain-containing protein [Pseudonocardia broussonetiae]|uniref:PspC domain-containing protein n=1 Tax=Pseudonocardia broussonetiae TaxID=2736640 RepID=A0A6M6JGN2_9PSEU|nr:PspC domain-containing protein [Pseudonocardia broussonetiae]QJY46200.1 PspC domain-containing protein [Pseudonocardia broussonetiae]